MKIQAQHSRSHVRRSVSIALLAAVMLSPGCAQQARQPPNAGSAKAFEAVVAHVDVPNRLLTLWDRRGNNETYLVSGNTEDLAHIGSGTRVRVEPDQIVVVEISLLEAAASGRNNYRQSLARYNVGATADFRRVLTTTVVGAVEHVDTDAGTLRLLDYTQAASGAPTQGTGSVHKTLVAQNPAMLGDIRSGEIVTVTYTEAVHVEVAAKD
jgi:hypothetical protein